MCAKHLVQPFLECVFGVGVPSFSMAGLRPEVADIVVASESGSD